MRYLYTFLLTLALPLVLLRILWRSRRAPGYRQRWQERLGRIDLYTVPNGLWIHAVSVGEVQAIAPLVRAVKAERPDLPLCITTTTPTGSAQVLRLFGGDVIHCYMPYDLPWVLRRFLDRLRPAHLLMVETEVWPNLLQACRERGISTLLANARMSDRSLRGYQRVGGFSRQVFSLIDRVAAQTEADAQRFAALGVPPYQITVTGSIKFDVQVPASVEEQVEVMRRSWGGRPVWVAASTHDGEDEIMLAAHSRLLRRLPKALLVLVPRHPERFDRVTALIMNSGLYLARRSEGAVPDHEAQVYLGDTMGELPVMLGAADAAFIGGSLSRTGGHNMLEAAAQGVPVCFGPYTFNFELISRMLLDCGAARRVQDADDITQLMAQWLSDASLRSAAGEAGRQMVARNRGALRRLRELLDHQLDASSHPG